MNIRLGEKLLADLRAAAAKYDCTYSEIAQKALRRARRSGVDLASVEVESTYRGEAIRFDLDTKNQGTDAETLRRALTWYLSQYDLTVPRNPGFSTDLCEKRDYVVVDVL